MEASEGRRLLYVAATRARDRLVISLFGHVRNKDGVPVGRAAGADRRTLSRRRRASPRSTRTAACWSCRRVCLRAHRRAGRPAGRARPGSRAARVAGRRRASCSGVAGEPAPATSPSGLEHVDEAVRTGGPGAPAGRAQGARLWARPCTASWSCATSPTRRPSRAAAAAVAAELERPDLADEAAELAGACWRAEPVRAGRGGRPRRRPPGAAHRRARRRRVVLSGAIDLVYRDGDEWVVVDYKTDRDAEPEVLRERYEPQGAAYALAVEAAHGRRRARGLLRRRARGRARRARARRRRAPRAGAGGDRRGCRRRTRPPSRRARPRRRIARRRLTAGQPGKNPGTYTSRQRPVARTPGPAPSAHEEARMSAQLQKITPMLWFDGQAEDGGRALRLDLRGRRRRPHQPAARRLAAGRRVHARRAALHGDQRRTAVHVHPRGLVRGGLRDAGGGRPLLGALSARAATPRRSSAAGSRTSTASRGRSCPGSSAST